MKRKFALAIFALLLVVLSAPLAAKMVLEKFHMASMERQFQIESPAYLSGNYSWHGTDVSVSHDNVTDSYQDPWGESFLAADIQLAINEEIAVELPNYAVREDYAGRGQYSSHIVHFLVREKNLEKLVIFLNMSRQHIAENENGDHIGYVSDEELAFRTYTISQDGSIEKDDFLFTERDGFQTELINYSAMYPAMIGYYTDAWHSFPLFLFPFSFPFFTFILGGTILISQVIVFLKNRSFKTTG